MEYYMNNYMMINSILAMIFYLGTGFALGFMFAKKNTKKVAQKITELIEQKLIFEEGVESNGDHSI